MGRTEILQHIGNGVPSVAAEVESLLVNPAQASAVFGTVADVGGNLERTLVAIVGIAHVDVANALRDE